MHELGVLMQALKRVQQEASKKGIKEVKYIGLEIGEVSGYVGAYFMKLHPMARDMFPALKSSQLRLYSIPGDGLRIREIAY